MAEKDVQAVQRLFDAWSRRDVDAVVGMVHEEVEWHPAQTAGGVEGTAYRGADGIRRYHAELDEVWAELRIEVESYREAPDGRVLQLGRFKAIGRGSGVPVDEPQAVLVEIRDGKMVAAWGFMSHQAAVEAAGLSE